MYKENIYFKRSKTEVVVKVLGSKWFWFGLWAVVTVLSLTANYQTLQSKYNLKCSVGGYFTTKEQCHRMAHPKPDISLVPVESVLHKFQIIKIAQASESTEAVNMESLLNAIYRQESSSGKNDSCMAKGRYNGYGYAQSKFSWKCYETREEVRGHVSEWIQDKLSKGYTLGELLCYYNEGVRKSECPYSIKVKSFIQ